MNFAVSAEHRVELKESEKKDKYLESLERLKKKKQQLWNMKVTVIPIVIGALCTFTKGLIKGLEDWEIRQAENYPDNSIIKIGQNSEKNLGDLMKFVVIQTPVRNKLLTLV